MTDAEIAADAARQLLANPILAGVLDAIMADAFAEFKSIPVTAANIEAVIALQARANAAHEVHDRLEAIITASGVHDGGVVVETRPTAE